MFILGISGRKHAGKTTLARAFRDKHCMFAAILGFADPMKEYLSQLYGIKRDLLEDDEFKESIIPGTQTTWRKALVDQGVLLNSYGGTPYTDYMERVIRECDGPVIVADVRRPHEVEMLRRLGGKVIRLLRNPHNIVGQIEDELDNYKDFDLTIPDGTSVEVSVELARQLVLA